MNDMAPRGQFVIIATLMLSIVLTILPLPEILRILRPSFVLMCVIFWIISIPHRVGIFWAFGMGLMVDVALGNVLGIHGFSFGVIAYLIQILANRLRLFPYWKQSMVVGLFVALDLLIALWLENFIEGQPRTASYWWPSLTSALLWLPVFVALRGLRRAYKVQ